MAAVWFGTAGLRTYLTKGVEDVVEVLEDLTLGDLGDVVHGLACIIPNPRILVRKAGQDRGHNDFEILGEFLRDERRGQRVRKPARLPSLFYAATERDGRGLTGPRAIAAAARPIRPPLRA
jgi:hypothetical protein